VKACGGCHRLFDDSSGFCPVDGTKLDPVSPLAFPKDAEDKRIGKRT
jgi:hypothetical protein